jgi:hypothetical protein
LNQVTLIQHLPSNTHAYRLLIFKEHPQFVFAFALTCCVLLKSFSSSAKTAIIAVF